MEPQDNKKIALRKAINAHEEVEALLSDLMQGSSDSVYTEMLDRITQNLLALRAEEARSDPADLV